MSNMITFACRRIKQEELIRCSFNLNKTEYNVLMFLLNKNREFTTIKIAEKMKLERTTVQKAIKNLLNKKLVKRRQENLPKGGYIFFYKVNDRDKIKKEIQKIVYQWYESVKKRIDEL